ncbi:MAG TPA: hypothetical protein PKM73_13015 [Verrucomicrobiota bacterium]|nr:hypothetical protein [Verrucomicrobiota bacterium]HNU50530.1 hypothetical protein [Verrucomicrobiota bacterium]
MKARVHPEATSPPALSRGRRLTRLLILAGGAGALLGLALDVRQFAHSWLVAFACCLSLSLGCLFLVLVHHLVDAAWSVPVRRIGEHGAALLFPWLALCFVPVAVLAPELMDWRRAGPAAAGHGPGPGGWAAIPWLWYGASAICFGVWGWLAHRLRRESLLQDNTGAAACTHASRRLAAGGTLLYAVTVTLAAALWIQAAGRGSTSTLCGVYYFAGSVWAALAAVTLIAMILKRAGALDAVLHEHLFRDLGTLLLAFTLFYAYIHFCQYFIIWYANLPAETQWYAVRDAGGWRGVGLTIVLGHFLLPFLALLRSDLKARSTWMAPLCLWVGLMHYGDMAFNVLPGVSPGGFPWSWVWLHLACLALILGLMARVFLRDLAAHSPYPIRDPRLAEAVGRHPALAPPTPQDESRDENRVTNGQSARAVVPPGQRDQASDHRGRDRLRSALAIGAAVGVLLIPGGLAWQVAKRTRAPAIDQARAELRQANWVALCAENRQALTTYGWIDRSRGILRLPVDRAIELSLDLWKDPEAGRSNLLERLAKATAKVAEQPNIYE